MQQRLFRDDIGKRRKPALERSLHRYDEQEFEGRLERLNYLKKVFPSGIAFGADFETIIVFEEVRSAFVNGEFVATILLANAFIERWLEQTIAIPNSLSKNKRTLNDTLEFAENGGLLPDYLIKQIHTVRTRRNPLMHLKSGHPNTIMERLKDSLRNGENPSAYDILLSDAKHALSTMYAVLDTQVGT